MRWFIPALAAAWLAAQPAAGRTLWVLQAPDRIAEYDAATFTARRTVTVPRRVVERPEHLAVNTHGQLLAAADDLIWVWDGGAAREWKVTLAPDVSRQWFLAAAGDGLYGLETRLTLTRDRDGVEQSVRGAAKLLRTDLSGSNARDVFSLPDLPSCQCETGACSETCPVWIAWAPNAGLGDVVLATRYVEGQLQSDFQESVIYRRRGTAWTPTALSAPIESPLTASGDATLLAAAIGDAGCCGWINESSNQLIVINKGARTVVFDEWARFDNRNYDATFMVSAAELSPSAARLAYTVAADAPKANEEIRLSSDGKDNPPELARIRKAVSELPAVEIVEIANPARTRVTIAGAELVGWLDADQILVAQNGQLAVFDRQGSKTRDLPIRVRRAADAFLR